MTLVLPTEKVIWLLKHICQDYHVSYLFHRFRKATDPHILNVEIDLNSP